MNIIRSIDYARGRDWSAYTLAERGANGTLRIIECGELKIRKVRNRRRAAKLRKRGVDIHWSVATGCWLWEMRREWR